MASLHKGYNVVGKEGGRGSFVTGLCEWCVDFSARARELGKRKRNVIGLRC